MTGDLRSRIREAIESRRVIRFHYDGGMRTVEPHSHGVTASGEECLIGYQTGGHSTESHPYGWYVFDVAGVEGLVLTDQLAVGLRPGFPEDSLTTVYATVETRSGADRRLKRDRRSGTDRRTRQEPIDFPERRQGEDRRTCERRSIRDRRKKSED